MRVPPRGPAPWAFLAGTVAWTWVFLGLAILTGRPWLAFPTAVLTVLGFLGPVVVPSLLLAAGSGDEPLGAFWRRSLDPRTLPARWYLIAVGLLALTVVVPAFALPGAPGRPQVGPVMFLLVGFLAGAAEEPGWRGYGQEGLQRRLPVLAASLVVAAFWVAWHLPMFWLAGTYQHGLGVGTAQFWWFQAAIVVTCPIYAWLYNASGRVVFSAVWFHAGANVVKELVGGHGDDVARVAVTAVVAALLVAAGWSWMRQPAATRPARATRRSTRRTPLATPDSRAAPRAVPK